MSDWSPTRRLGAYAAALAVVFVAALGVGRLGPDVAEEPVDHGGSHVEATTTTSTYSGSGFVHDHRSHATTTTTTSAP